MCRRIFFIRLGHIDCKTFAFKVKKTNIFAPIVTKLFDLEVFELNFFALQILNLKIFTMKS